MAAPRKAVSLLKMSGITRILPSLRNKNEFWRRILQLSSSSTPNPTPKAYDSVLRSLKWVQSLACCQQNFTGHGRWHISRQNNADTDENDNIKHLLSSRLSQKQNTSLLLRRFSTSRPPSNNGDSDHSDPPKNPLRLMVFDEKIWPHPFKSLRNMFMSFLISGYMERSFTMKRFLDGAEQAVTMVSRLISKGKFDELDGLVTKDAIWEIKKHYNILDPKQKEMLAVDPRDLFYRFVYEIGMIFDDQTEKRFVEITAVFQGYHGLAAMKDRGEHSMQYEPNVEEAGELVYVCNYRFIREYTKELVESSDWIINKLNHFSPKDIVKESGFFDR